MKYSIESARKYSKINELDKWLQEFLRDNDYDHANPNIPLADGILLEERFYVGPILLNLDKINTIRIQKDIDNENDLLFYQQKEDGILNNYDNYNMPPLILEYKDNELNLVDGNHRYTALKKLNINKYYVIIWGNKDKEKELKNILKIQG